MSSQYSDPSQYDFLVKTVIVGDSGVGKSAMMRRFSKNEFSEHFIATIGVDFEIREVKVQEKIVKCQLWDTAGQERFRSITAAYYRGAGLIMIVFDVTSEDSFASIGPWIKEVRQYNADAPLMLVANKIDLVSKRVVTSDQIKALSQQLDLPVVEASAKDCVGVDEAFLLRIREYVDNQLLLPPSAQKKKPANNSLSGGSSVSVADAPTSGIKCCV